MNRGIKRMASRRRVPSDPTLPSIDDDLETLIAKSEAIHSARRGMPSRMARMRNQELPATPKEETKAKKPSGLMQRPNRG